MIILGGKSAVPFLAQCECGASGQREGLDHVNCVISCVINTSTVEQVMNDLSAKYEAFVELKANLEEGNKVECIHDPAQTHKLK